MNNFFVNKNVKINNDQELKEKIRVLKGLIDIYYGWPNRSNEYPIMPFYFGIRLAVQSYYKKQFKHEKDQTDILLNEMDDMISKFSDFSEKHKNKHRRIEFRTNLSENQLVV